MSESTLEVLKHSFSETFMNGRTTYLIKEVINDGQEKRYYEITNVPNKPQVVKITLFALLSPRLLRTRGRDIYRSLGALRSYVHSTHSSIKII